MGRHTAASNHSHSACCSFQELSLWGSPDGATQDEGPGVALSSILIWHAQLALHCCMQGCSTMLSAGGTDTLTTCTNTCLHGCRGGLQLTLLTVPW
jgi:hypothetical protein